MLRAHSQQHESYAQLYAMYHLEWQAFSTETARWRLLEEAEHSNPNIVREAKSLAESAEDRYRRARNKMWEHIMEHQLRKPSCCRLSRFG
jgi:uncharacterized membrane protein YgaE (UPF0421/DUF939 family)